jgi:PleD family two-component response regulator
MWFSRDDRADLKELKRNCFELIILNWHMPNMYCLVLFKEVINDHKLRDIYCLLLIAEIKLKKIVKAISVDNIL